MSNDGEIEVDFGVDTSPSTANLNRLREQVRSVTADLEQLSSVAARNIERLTRDVNERVLKARGDDKLSAIRSQLRMQGEATGNFGKGLGFYTGQQSSLDIAGWDAVVKNFTKQIDNSIEQVTARITDAHMRAYQRAMRTSGAAVEASAAQSAAAQAQKIRRFNDPVYMAAAEKKARQSEADTVREAEIGRGRFQTERTLERLTGDGGAGILAIQSRVMIGYQALSQAMNVLRGTAGFVVELDKNLHNLQAITATTAGEMGSLEKRLISVASQTKFTTVEISQAATVLAQAGLSAREVGQAIEGVSKLATAAGTDLTQAVDVVTSAISAFNLDISQAMDVSNQFTAALNGSKLNLQQLALSIQYVGATASTSGMSLTEVLASVGALANAGVRSGSTMGTGMRQLLVDLATPTKKFTDTLERLGLTQQDVDVKSRGLVGVLKTLKDAGFSTSDAFDAFEVRAASAATAMMNNLSVATELQKSFRLTTAAAEANAIQMQSFANIWANFKSVLGTLSFEAFKPFLAMLKSTVSGLTSVFIALGQVPLALQALGTAIGALATGVAVKTFLALIGGMAGAFGIATPVIVAFGAPLALMAAGLTAAAGGFVLLSRTMSGGLSQLDKAKSLMAMLAGSADESQGKIEALSETMHNVLVQRDSLNMDPLLREAKIGEVIEQFDELGLSISASTSSVDDLIAALKDLKAQELVNQGIHLVAQAGAQQLTATELKAQLTAEQAKSFEGLNGIASLPYAVPRPQISAATGRQFKFNSPADMGQTAQFLGQKLQGQFASQAIAPHLMELFNYTLPGAPVDANRMKALQESVKVERDTKLAQVSQAELAGNAALAKTMRVEAAALDAVINRAEEILRLAIEFEKLQGDQGLTKRDIDFNNARQMLSNAGLLDAATALQQQGYSDKQRVTRRIQSPGVSTADANIIGAGAAGSFTLQLDNLTKRIVAQLQQQTTMSPTEIDELVAQILSENRLPELKADFKDLGANAAEQANKVRKATLEAQIKTIDKQLASQKSKADSSLSRDVLTQIQTYTKQLFDRKRDLTNLLFDTKRDASGDKAEREIVEQERTEALVQLVESMGIYADGLVQRRTAINKMIFEETEDALESEIKVLQDKMRDLADRISATKPGAVLDGLITQYNALLDAMRNLESMQRINEIGGAFNDMPGAAGTPPGAAHTAMKYFMGQGWSQVQASGIVGNLIAESGMNPTAVGDGGKAFGLAQWHPDRQAHLKMFASNNELDVNDLMTQLKFVQYEMQNRETKAYHDLKRAKTPYEATSAFIGYERPAGWSAANPSAGHNFTGRYGNAQRLAGTGYNSAGIVDGEAVETLEDAVRTTTIKAAKELAQKITQADTKQIAGLMTQSKGSSSPEAILSIAESVKVLYDEILSEQVKAYEVEHKSALDAGNEMALQGLEEIRERVGSERSQKLLAVLEQWDRAVTEQLQKPLEDAQKRLAEAQRPENASKYSATEIKGFESEVYRREQAVLANEVASAEQRLLLIRRELAAVTAAEGENSAAAILWKEREAEATRQLTSAMENQRMVKQMSGGGEGSTSGSFDAAMLSYKISSGFTDAMGNTLPMAKQVENAWLTVLNGLDSAFQGFFSELASGTATAESLFKNFARSVIQMLAQMITKALVFNMLTSMTGIGGGGEGSFGGIISSLIGVKGAATGEVITGGVPGRDSVLRKVEPGEVILRRSAVTALGEDKARELNNLGPNRRSQPGILAGMAPQQKQRDLNIYVVTPEQAQGLGPDDVVATVSDNILRKGQLAKMIKQVAMGG